MVPVQALVLSRTSETREVQAYQAVLPRTKGGTAILSGSTQEQGGYCHTEQFYLGPRGYSHTEQFYLANKGGTEHDQRWCLNSTAEDLIVDNVSELIKF